MAGVQERGGSYRVCFRFQGKQVTFPVGKVTREEAEAKAAQAEYLLLRLRQRLIELPPGVGIADFLQHDGKAPVDSVPATRPAKLGELRDRFLTIHAGAHEKNTLYGASGKSSDTWSGRDPRPASGPMPPPPAPDERVPVPVPVPRRLTHRPRHLVPGHEPSPLQRQRLQHLPPRLDQVQVRRVHRLDTNSHRGCQRENSRASVVRCVTRLSSTAYTRVTSAGTDASTRPRKSTQSAPRRRS